MGYPQVLGARALAELGGEGAAAAFSFGSALPAGLVLRVLAISVGCAAVESFPADRLDDNVSVPLAGAIATALLF